MTTGEVRTLKQQVHDLEANLEEASRTALEVYLKLEMLKTANSVGDIEELGYIQSRLWELSWLSFTLHTEIGRNAAFGQIYFQSGCNRVSIAVRADKPQEVANSDIQLPDLVGPKLGFDLSELSKVSPQTQEVIKAILLDEYNQLDTLENHNLKRNKQDVVSNSQRPSFARPR